MNIISVKNSDIQVLQQDIKEHIVETNFMINLMFVINSKVYGLRGIRKVMGGGGGGKSKNKNRAGETEKKNCAPKKFKKKFVQRLFNRENYKLSCCYKFTIRGRGRGGNLPRATSVRVAPKFGK
jgi:hypothetical protein